jgi:NTE family protein
LFAFDTETTSLNYSEAEVVGISFALEPARAAYVPLAHCYPGAPVQLSRDAVLAQFKPLLESDRPGKVHREFFGDGSMRQIAPVSPALHLGADRVLIVGTGRQTLEQARARSSIYPSLAQIAGHALNSIFLDSLAVDIERMERINRTVRLIPPEKREGSNLTLRPVQVLFITPSQPIERIAARFSHDLPRSVRFILRPTGALSRAGSNLASYLLFEESFCRALIDLGYQDTLARESEVKEFFSAT